MACGRMFTTPGGIHRQDKGAAAPEEHFSFEFVSCQAVAFLCPARLCIVSSVLWVMSLRHGKFLSARGRDASSGAAEELAV